MGGGNGNKAAQKRARNQKNEKKKPASQLKSNEKANGAKSCAFCKRGFQTTMTWEMLKVQHEHPGKTFDELFPDAKNS